MLALQNTVRLPADQPPILLVVIDTEEEFDWSAEPDRNATHVTAMSQVDRLQRVFEPYGIVPAYVLDYPVASQEAGFRPLKEVVDSGGAVVGAHLHPWVNPPHDEPLSRSNMYPGNLSRELEAAKLRALSDKIEESFGARPLMYKAGRYGVGANSAAILEEQGFEIDLSLCPPVDYRADGGPDFSRASCEPGWFGRRRRLLEIPITGGYVGLARAVARTLHPLVGKRLLAPLRLPGILSRLGILDRLMLSPEGFNSAEHVKLTKSLLRRGVRTFTWSFHSPSVMPGGTPYVRTEREREDFLASFRRFFDFFFGELGGATMTPFQLKQHLEAAR